MSSAPGSPAADPAAQQAQARAEHQARHLLALLAVEGIGPVRARTLISAFGSPEAVFQQPAARLARLPDLSAATIQALQQPPAALARADAELAWCAQRGIQMRTYLHADFPRLLRADPSLPLLVFQQGPLALNDHPVIAIVGTRKPSDYGRRQAARFATALARQGFVVASGLAYGIDAVAHEAVLQAGGLTVAVLGHGLDRVYPPTHADLARRIVASGGALLSEYPSGTEPRASNFPERNRIIAGISRATIVIEAAEKGGALITAKQAFELNREVFAMPGPLDAPTSAGCHALIQQNVARLLTDPEEVVAELQLLIADESPVGAPRRRFPEAAPAQPQLFDALPAPAPPAPASPSPAAKPARATRSQVKPTAPSPPEPQSAPSASSSPILAHLDARPKLLDELVALTGLSAAALLPQLLELEFAGQVKQLPGPRFCRA